MSGRSETNVAKRWVGIIAVACIAMTRPSSAAPVDQVFATAYGASGSNQSTTGSMTASRTTLDVASELDFRDGDGVAVWGAGPAFSAGPLTGVAAKQQGVVGKTTYSYKIAPIDHAGGIDVPVVVSVANGNATLSTANNITINVTYGAGDAGFVVWKSTNGGAYCYDGASTEKDWMDTGWIPTSAGRPRRP